jgi:hypothetical protein
MLDDCEAKQQAPRYNTFRELASHVPAETKCLTQLTSIHKTNKDKCQTSESVIVIAWKRGVFFSPSGSLGKRVLWSIY